ncbi:hypothetical protein AKO1_014553 [Acrasis kona]|uniref:Uncharacterized protein n=1 Tax=Acrasis kona TaxID=1008807 RepID=A0AAW2Z145_9EUKA
MVEAGLAKVIYDNRKNLQISKIPKLEETMALVVLILNIIFPGIGTIVAAILTDSDEKRKWNLIFGVLQILLSFLLIGWLWSILWGVIIYYRNTGAMKNMPDALLS